VIANGRLKTKGNFNLLALKVVVVAYERWLLTRGSKKFDCKTFGILENWSLRRGDLLQEVGATAGSTVFIYQCR